MMWVCRVRMSGTSFFCKLWQEESTKTAKFCTKNVKLLRRIFERRALLCRISAHPHVSSSEAHRAAPQVSLRTIPHIFQLNSAGRSFGTPHPSTDVHEEAEEVKVVVDRVAHRQEGRPGGEGGGRVVSVQRGPEAELELAFVAPVGAGHVSAVLPFSARVGLELQLGSSNTLG